MARRRRRSSLKAVAPRGRVYPNLRKTLATTPRYTAIPLRRPRVVPVEDRRLYQPLPVSPRTILDKPAEVRPKTVKSLVTPHRLTFADARRVAICRKRSARRRVIFASGVGGRKGIRKRRVNEYSHISCQGKR